MALPSYWISVNRKDLAERAIVAKREQEAKYLEKCKSTAQFHRDANFFSSKYRSLEECTSGNIPKVNEESGKTEAAKAKKKETLQERRQKLAMLLTTENDIYMTELKAKSDDDREKDPWNVGRLKEQIEELKQRRKVDEDELQRRNMSFYPPFKSTTPYAVEHEKTFQRQVKVAWEEQKELEKKTLNARAEEEKRKQAVENKKRQALNDAKEAETKRSEIADQWAQKIKKNMNDVVGKDAQSDILKDETEELFRYQQLIDNVVKKRNDIKGFQKERELRISFFRPSKEKIRKMALEVRQKMETDLKTLSYLCDMENKNDKGESSLAMDDVVVAMDRIKSQIHLEDARMSEIQPLFHEEATKLWAKRKQDWDNEGELHEEVMNDIFNGLKTQIQEKIAQSLIVRKQLIQSREDLLNHLAENDQMAKQVDRELIAKKNYFLEKAEQWE